jgi:uncharacterized protein YoxC
MLSGSSAASDEVDNLIDEIAGIGAAIDKLNKNIEKMTEMLQNNLQWMTRIDESLAHLAGCIFVSKDGKQQQFMVCIQK